MARCYVCGQNRTKTCKVAGKNVCLRCLPYLGGPGITKEREVTLLVMSDGEGK